MYGIFGNVFEDDDTDEENEVKRGPRMSCISGHLSSPIYNTDCEFLIKELEIRRRETLEGKKHRRLCKRHYELIKKLEEYGQVVSIYDEFDDPIGWLQDWAKMMTVDISNDFSACFDALINFDVQKRTFLDPYIRGGLITEQYLRNENQKYIADVQKAFLDLKNDYKNMKKVELIKDSVCFIDIQDGYTKNFHNLEAERDVCWIVQGNRAVLFPTNLLLCALDKIQALFGLKMYWAASDAENKYEGFSILKEGSRIYSKLVQLRGKMKQDYFSFVGSWEPLVVGKVIANTDDVGCNALLDTQKQEMIGMLDKYKIDRAILDELLPRSELQNEVLMYLELIGMAKITGYPTLNAENLLDQIKEYGTDPKRSISQEIIDKVLAVVRREFCLNYYQKHMKYPVFIEIPEEFGFLRKNRPCPKKMLKEYELWGKVRFGKTLDFNFCIDESELAKDSATAVPREMWAEMYDPCSFRQLYDKAPPPKVLGDKKIFRRVVDAYLNSEPEKVRSLILERDNGKFSPSHHVCVECGKECELKIGSGRAFTKQTPEQRLIQTCMELNTAEAIFPYVPQQSMTDGEIKNTRRVLDQVKELLGPTEFMSIDFQKWCLNWRHITIKGLGEMYDELFGFNRLFKEAHLQFVNCWVFCNNRLSPPDYDHNGRPIPGPYFIDNFLGGMEGMHQKRWTHFCVALLILCLEQSDLKGEIMGQGDNQVILLQYPRDTADVKISRDCFINNLEGLLRGIGHKLKEKETWFSKHLHEYSKQRIYKGVAVSSGTKKASKIMPDINDGLFSIPSMMATLNTITEGIARSSYTPDSAYILNQLMCANLICRRNLAFDPKCNLTSNSRKEVIRQLLQFPADFGGLPTSSYYSHSVRGHGDKITLWLHVAMIARDYDHKLFAGMERMWQLFPSTPIRDYLDRTRLYEDVYSIRIKSLPSAENEIKTLTLSYLKSGQVTNPVIRRLHDSDQTTQYNDIIREVDKMSPVFPQLGHELLRNSNPGILRALQRKLTGSKTVENITKCIEGISLIQLINRKNQELTEALRKKSLGQINLARNQPFFSKLECPAKGADLLREISWEVKLVGVTQPIFSHQVTVYDKDVACMKGKDVGVLVRPSGEIQMNPMRCFKMYGPLKPFIGSTTQVKLKKSSIDMVDKTSYTRAFKRLGIIRSWMKSMNLGAIVELTERLMREKKDLITGLDDSDDLEELCASITSGNIFHRFKSTVDHDTAIVNCLPCVTGHFEHSSNQMGGMTAGGKDFTIFYQLLYVSNVVFLSQIGRMKNHHSPEYFMTFECVDACTRDVTNVELKTSATSSEYNSAGTIAIRPSIISPPLVIQGIKEIMSYEIGRKLAYNVDANHRRFHLSYNISSNIEAKKDSISLNDLRQLDMKIIMISMLTNSHRGRLLYEERNNILNANSEDRSFTFFAEKVLEAGMRGEVFRLLDTDVGEHAAITTSQRFSGFISSVAGKFMEKLGEELVAKALAYEFKDQNKSREGQVIEFSAYVLMNCRKATRATVDAVIRQVNTYHNNRLAKKLLGIESERVPLTSDTVITTWRASDRENVNVYPTRIKYHACASRVERYPVEEIVTYHSKRAGSVSKLEKGLDTSYQFKELCYIARPLGFISTGCNKFMEIIIALNIFESLQQVILEKKDDIDCYHAVGLAEGSGGTLLLLLLMFPGLKGMYNTWMRPDIACREVATDNYPPAMYDAGVSIDRFVDLNLLASGETDITTEGFRRKLQLALQGKRIAIVTMDAESPTHGNNLEFLVLIPTILHSNPILVMFKLFYLYDIEDAVTNVLKNHPGYEWLLFKPISSNPTGPEIYLVIKKIQLQSSSFENLRRTWSHSKQYLGKHMELAYDDLRLYVDTAIKIGDLIGSLSATKTMFMTNRYARMFPRIGCSLSCPVFLDNLCDELDVLHNHTEGSAVIYAAIRNKGVAGMIDKLIREITFLITYRETSFNATETLRLLTGTNVSDCIDQFRKGDVSYIISRSTSTNSEFFSGWKECKTFMRHLPWTKPCDCKVEVSYVESMRKCLSYKLCSNIQDFGLSKCNWVKKYRRTKHDPRFNLKPNRNRFALFLGDWKGKPRSEYYDYGE